jgi:radical SAM superfamily enzyme
MRAVLVFPPRASATYVPLGIASLAPFIESVLPGTSVRLLDLNIAAWIRIAGTDPRGQDLMNFVNKGTCVNDIKTVLKDSAKAGISNLGLMIFGLPTSTDPDLDQTLTFLNDIYTDLEGLTASTFVLFDNTHFHQILKQFSSM